MVFGKGGEGRRVGGKRGGGLSEIITPCPFYKIVSNESTYCTVCVSLNFFHPLPYFLY